MAKGSGSDFSQAAKQQQAAAKAGKLPPAAGKEARCQQAKPKLLLHGAYTQLHADMQAPFWQWWGSEASKHSNSTKNGAQEFLSRFHGNAKGFKLPKFEMPGAQQYHPDKM